MFIRTLPWIVLSAVAVASGCDPAHPARPELEALLDAVSFGDTQRLWRMHIDSTSASHWCGPEFRAILKKAATTTDPAECARVRAVGADDLEKMSDELRLAVQVAAFTCAAPRGTCIQYGKQVFDHAAANSQLLSKRATSYEIRRLFGEDEAAVAYVEFEFADGATLQRVFELRRVENRWVVAEGLFP